MTDGANATTFELVTPQSVLHCRSPAAVAWRALCGPIYDELSPADMIWNLRDFEAVWMDQSDFTFCPTCVDALGLTRAAEASG